MPFPYSENKYNTQYFNISKISNSPKSNPRIIVVNILAHSLPVIFHFIISSKWNCGFGDQW
jgi:hypothetical protein